MPLRWHESWGDKMIRFIAAGLCALMIAVAAPATAQVTVSADKHRAVMARTTATLDAAQVIETVLNAVIVDMERVNLASEAELPGAVERLYRTIADGRREISAQITLLTGLPKIADEGDPPDVFIVDQMVLTSIEQAHRMDRMLADIETMYRAYESGDDAKARASLASTQNIVVFVAESMALRLKGAATLYPAASFDGAILVGTGCFYEGLTAYYRIGFSYEENPITVASDSMVQQAVTELDAAIACMEEAHSRAGISMQLEARRPMLTHSLTRLRDGLVPLRVDYLANMEFGRTILMDIRGPLASGRGLGGLMEDIDADTTRYEERNGDIARRTVRLNQTGGR